FGAGKQWGNFGAIGAAWVFSEEKWVTAALPWLNLGKFRMSYGITGSDQIGNYGYFDSYRTGTNYLNPVLVATRIANSEYGWESNHKIEAGFETSAFDNRLQLDFAVFRHRSGNQLVGYPLPDMVGFPSVQANLPATV